MANISRRRLLAGVGGTVVLGGAALTVDWCTLGSSNGSFDDTDVGDTVTVSGTLSGKPFSEAASRPSISIQNDVSATVYLQSGEADDVDDMDLGSCISVEGTLDEITDFGLMVRGGEIQ